MNLLSGQVAAVAPGPVVDLTVSSEAVSPVLGSPIELRPVVWSPREVLSSPYWQRDTEPLRNIDEPMSSEQALALSGIADLAAEWVAVERGRNGSGSEETTTGPHTPTGPN